MTVQPSMRKKYGQPHATGSFPCACHYCISQYIAHNPNCLNSGDIMVRNHGKCGCRDCADTRAWWQYKGLLPKADGLTVTFDSTEKPAQPQAQPVRKRGTVGTADIKMCERCETFMLGKAAGWMQYVANPETDNPTLKEICPGCVAEFLEWFAHAPHGDRPNAYKEAYTAPAPETDEVKKASAEQLAAALFEKLMSQQTAIESGRTDA